MFFMLYSCKTNINHTYNIINYGAETGKLSTKAIQSAINDCYQNGGGMVYVPPGEFISGTIFLKSNVHLYLENGSIIKGSADMNDYSIEGKKYGLVYAENSHNITISGTGTLDGNATFFHDVNVHHDSRDYDKQYTRQKDDFVNLAYGLEDGPIEYKERPDRILNMLYCENVTVKDITMYDSPFWTVQFGRCSDVLIEGIRIFTNLLVPNSDGVDLIQSRNVRISNCDFRCGDDAIVVRGVSLCEKIPNPQYGNFSDYCENITVTNCILQSRSAGVRVGYGDLPIRNCIFSNLVIHDSNRGIGIFARSEATIENIFFDNIIISCRLHKGNWWGAGEPIHISSIPMSLSALVNLECGVRATKETSGIIRNLHFSNITAESENGIVVWGDKADDIQDLTFENIRLLIKESPIAKIYGGNFDLRPTNSTATSIFEHDIPAIFARNVDGFLLKNVNVNWSGNLLPFYTYALECENVKGLELEQFKGNAAQSSMNPFFLKNTQK